MSVLRFALGAVVMISATLPGFGESSSQVRDLFANPPREYSSSPLWVWNDDLTEDQVLATLRDLAAQDVKQVFVHPRPGLMTPYLSDSWFRLWKAVLREADVLDMNVWIYDENSYPSGFAGGFVPKAMPESHGLGLKLTETDTVPAWDDATVAIYRLSDSNAVDVSEAARSGSPLGAGRYLVAATEKSKSTPWFAGTNYVDLLRPGVTEKFLEITLGAYEREIGAEFGKRVPGSFTDEPHLAPAGGFHWTPDLPEQFAARRGYSLMETLPSLIRPIGDYRRVRHDYYRTLLELFIERWAKPYYDYCANHNLEFTGHYWEHEWPKCGYGPDNMAMYAWHQRPAIDTLFNQYDEGPHAQFGNVRAVMELGSVSNQLGLKRTLCEAYGGGGWDLRFEDMKRIGDWLYVLGVNTLDEHLSYITMRGARKYDYPQSFSYHASWWDSYHVMARYFTRLSAALSHGAPVQETLVIEPTGTAWMYQSADDREHLEQLGNTFQKLVTDLAKAQVEFDLGSEDIIARRGRIDGGRFVIGERAYRTVVLPSHMETLNETTFSLLSQFIQSGGNLLIVGEPALTRLDGVASAEAAAFAGEPGISKVAEDVLAAQLLALGANHFSIAFEEVSAGQPVFHQRRRFDDGELLFVVNTSNTEGAKGTVHSACKRVEKWDLERGTTGSYAFESDASGVHASIELPPCGSLLLFLGDSSGDSATTQSGTRTLVAASGETAVKRLSPNVLTLDYLDLKIGDQTYERVFMYEAARKAFQSIGLEEDPWDHAVQFGDELVSRVVPPNDGYEATYRFTLEGEVAGPVHVVVERPDLYTITCNGQVVQALPGEWWLDRAFGRIDLTSAIREGENTVVLKASPMTMLHEITAIYVLGDFALTASESGFSIGPSKPLGLGPWNAQGQPLYGHDVSYSQTYVISDRSKRHVVKLPDWYGSIAKVLVNGELAGHVGWQPSECDVSSLLKDGENRIDVIVTGTLKNTLGPHHGNPPLGIASPGSFRKGAEGGVPKGAGYHTIGYGLMKSFELYRE